jgi:hypothetical protein
MKKLCIIIVLIFTVGVFSATAFAKCYSFSNGGEYKACVNGDSFSDRKKARKNCSKAKGSDCGNVGSSSSSCHSNSGKCVDENGNLKRSLSGY